MHVSQCQCFPYNTASLLNLTTFITQDITENDADVNSSDTLDGRDDEFNFSGMLPVICSQCCFMSVF